LTGFFIMLVKLVCNSDFAICFVQTLLSMLNILLVVKCIGLFNPGWNNYLSILILLFFFPTQMIYANMIMAEMLFQTMLTLAFYFSLKYFLKRNANDFLWLNVFLSLAVLVKPVFYLFYIPWIIFVIWYFIKWKINSKIIYFALMLPATILVISWRNYKLTNVFQYSSVHENHVTNFSLRNAIQYEKGRTFADSVVTNIIAKAKEKVSYKEYREYLMTENYRLLNEYKTSFILLSIKGMLQFFIDPGRWDLFSFFDRIPEDNPKGFYDHFKEEGIKGAVKYVSSFSPLLIIYLIICAFVNIFILIMFIFFLSNKTIASAIRLFAFLLIMYIAMVTGLMGSARYRTAVYPVLLFVIPFAIEQIKAFSKKRYFVNSALQSR
jgi:hypothetical protein